MERRHECPETDCMPPWEKETLAHAEKVLGTIPKWYWENKAVIAKNRAELLEWGQSFSERIERVSKMLDNIYCTEQ